jgi:hypothetical protein
MTFNLNETGGTWDYTNGIGLQINWILMSGTDKHTTPDTWQSGNLLATSNQVNACDSASNDFKLSQVKLEKGTVATPFVARPFSEELALCQRYYEKSYNVDVDPGTVTEAGVYIDFAKQTTMYMHIPFAVEKLNS